LGRGIDPRDHEEAVFSSSEDRIRASQASLVAAGHSIVLRGTSPGCDRAWVSRVRVSGVAESLFSVLFPSDCRICSDPLLHISRLPSQISPTSHQRGVNLREAFSVARPSVVTGREVLLVDDGYTTGTTAAECARVLRRAGAAQVWVATLARTTKLASNPGVGGSQDDDEVDDPADWVNEEHLARAVGS
jgi:hypothetical protein